MIASFISGNLRHTLNSLAMLMLLYDNKWYSVSGTFHVRVKKEF